jgi:thioredoxin 1
MAGENVIEFTDENFADMVEASDKPVLVDFWAVWCGPCKAIAPIVEELADDFSDRVVVGKLNVDENREVPGRFRITSIPTVLLFNGGKVVQQFVGFRPKNVFTDALNSAIS